MGVSESESGEPQPTLPQLAAAHLRLDDRQQFVDAQDLSGCRAGGADRRLRAQAGSGTGSSSSRCHRAWEPAGLPTRGYGALGVTVPMVVI